MSRPSIRNQKGQYASATNPKENEELRYYSGERDELTHKSSYKTLKQQGEIKGRAKLDRLEELHDLAGRAATDRTLQQRQQKRIQNKRDRERQFQKTQSQQGIFQEPKSGLSSQGEITTKVITEEDAKILSERVAQMEEEYLRKGGDKKQTIDEYNPRLERQAYGIRQREQKRTGAEPTFPKFDEKYQNNILDIYSRANEKLKEIKEQYGAELGYGFHLRPSDDIETTIKKLEKAYDVLSDDYITRTMRDLKLDFIGNFTNHIDKDYSQKLVDAIIDLDDEQFYAILQVTGKSYLAYALDSMIKYDDYEHIMQEVDIIVKQANALKKEGKESDKADQEKADKVRKGGGNE